MLPLNDRNRFGWIAYYFTFIIYVVFVTSLTGFAIFQGNYYAAQHFNRAPIIGLDIPGRLAVQPLPIAHLANQSKKECIHDDTIDVRNLIIADYDVTPYVLLLLNQK